MHFAPGDHRTERASSSSLQHPLLRFVTGQRHCPLCTVTVLLLGEIWHGHKGPLFVPEVGHTMQSFPLVTQSWVSIAGLETLPDDCNPQTQTPSPSPTRDPSSLQYVTWEEKTGEQSPLFGALIPANPNLTCSKDGSEGLPELCPQCLCRTLVTWILQDHLNRRLSNFQVYSCPQEARNLADRSNNM